jgi:hypothetical protein
MESNPDTFDRRSQLKEKILNSDFLNGDCDRAFAQEPEFTKQTDGKLLKLTNKGIQIFRSSLRNRSNLIGTGSAKR